MRPLLLLLAALAGGCSRGESPPPNVLLISIDTLRADHLGCYGYGRPTSPNLDRLAAEGVLFEDSFSTSSWTLPSHASLLTSRHPASHGAERRDRPLARRVKTLAQVLRRAGFSTGAYTTWIYVSERFGFDRGFQSFEYVLPSLAGAPGASSAPAAPAADLVPRVEGWLAERGREPWFLFLHFIDPHMEYEPPLEHARVFDPAIADVRGGDYAPLDPYLRRDGREARPIPAEKLRRAVDLYDGEIRYTDEQIARVLALLPDPENTLIVVTADHGEEFFEHDALMSHGLTLYDEMLRVPLILRLPGGAHAGARPDVLARSIDVAPTVLELCGVDVPETFEGRSLLPAIRGGRMPGDVYSFASTKYVDGHHLWSVRSRTHKLVFGAAEEGEEGRFELYDLTADPGETNDLWPQLGSQQPGRDLREALEKWMAGGEAPQPGERVQLTPRERRRLEALGYVGDDPE